MKGRNKGNKLFQMRKARGFTISKLAKYTGFSPGYISDLETGKKVNPSKNVMDKVAKALDVKREEVF